MKTHPSREGRQGVLDYHPNIFKAHIVDFFGHPRIRQRPMPPTLTDTNNRRPYPTIAAEHSPNVPNIFVNTIALCTSQASSMRMLCPLAAQHVSIVFKFERNLSTSTHFANHESPECVRCVQLCKQLVDANALSKSQISRMRAPCTLLNKTY